MMILPVPNINTEISHQEWMVVPNVKTDGT